jgi:hypothetical protein
MYLFCVREREGPSGSLSYDEMGGQCRALSMSANRNNPLPPIADRSTWFGVRQAAWGDTRHSSSLMACHSSMASSAVQVFDQCCILVQASMMKTPPPVLLDSQKPQRYLLVSSTVRISRFISGAGRGLFTESNVVDKDINYRVAG